MLIDCSGQSHGESSTGGSHIEQDPEDRQAWFRSMWEGKSQDEPAPHAESSNDADDDDDFGDDFDEFAEGEGDDDFGDFDEATPTSAPALESQPAPPSASILAGLVSSLMNLLPHPQASSITMGKLTTLSASFRPQGGPLQR